MSDYEYLKILRDGLVSYPIKSPQIREERRKQKAQCTQWVLDRLHEDIDPNGTTGETPTCLSLFGTFIWSVMRDCVLERDEHKCRICGRPASEVHHIRPKSFGGSKYDPRNLVCLCNPCHSHVHKQIDEIVAQAIADTMIKAVRIKNRTLDEYV